MTTTNTNIVPNELNITINTSIPGYPKIKYNPSMTIKNIGKDKKVQFDPLVKLNKEVINKVPEDLREKQFFDKGYFDSLVNETLIQTSSNPAKNLNQANYYGYIDNNIKITLQTIFPDDSVIYIGDKPYVIADVQWTSGDRKIDTKFKEEEIDPDKITDPYLYSAIVKDDIVSGQQQLASLSPALIYGNHYSGPLDSGRGVTGSFGPGPAGPLPSGPGEPLPPGGPLPPGPSGTTITPIINISMTGPAAPPIAPIINITNPPPTPLLIGLTGPAASTSLVPYTGVTNNNYYYYYGPNKKLLISDSESDEDDKDDVEDTGPTIVEISNSSAFKTGITIDINTLSKRKLNEAVFKKTNYYNLLNMLYQTNTNPSMAEMINTKLSETTNTRVKNTNITYSQSAYNKSLKNFHMLANSGGGDCFFIALSDAINLYNNDIYNRVTTPNQTIISYDFTSQNGVIKYGIDKPFNVNILRQIVSDFYFASLNDPKYQGIINTANANTDILNDLVAEGYDEFEQNNNYQILPREQKFTVYIDFISQIYNSNDNFLVYLPTEEYINENVERFNPIRPFLPLTDVDQELAREYFLSTRYWGDQFAITAICRALQLNVIVLSYDNPQKTSVVSIDYGVFRQDDHNNCNDWNKYLFLFHYSNHYELMSFDYFYRMQKDKYNWDIIEKPKYIFNKNDPEFPPFYLIFFIYGCKYFGLEPYQKESFSWYPAIMTQIDEIVNAILQDDSQYTKSGTPKNELFIRYFNQFFIKNQMNPNKIAINSLINNSLLPNSQSNNQLILKRGGNLQYPNNYGNPMYGNPMYGNPMYGNPMYGNPQYGSPYLARNMLKQNYDQSKLAYYITIDMELYPGTEMSPEIKKQLKCRQKWNTVRKAWANFRGLPYVTQPIYAFYTPENKKDTRDNTRKNLNNTKPRNGGTRKNRTNK